MSVPAKTPSPISVYVQPVLAVCGVLLLLTGCAEQAPPQQETPAATAPAAAPAAPESATSFSQAVSGRYDLDHEHASLQFGVVHAFVANYFVRFNTFDVSLDLNAENPAASSVTVRVDPASVDSGHKGDYRATRPNARFATWDETLAKDTRWFNSTQYPEITFQSTQVEQTAPDKLRVTGDLTLLGQTHPVTLDVTLVGATASHVGRKRPALGISALGVFKRSEFGMTTLVGAGVSDEVTVRFEGEFLQPAAEPAAAPSA